MQVHGYGAFLGLAVATGWWFAEHRLEQAGRSAVARVFPWIAVGALIGARGYHVLTDFSAYVGKPWVDWIAVWNGGLGIFGALIGGFCTAAVYGVLQKWTAKDREVLFTAVIPVVPFMQAIGRLGNWWNQELYGTPSTLPWAIWVSGEPGPVHPLFAYEMAGLIVLGVFLLHLSRRQSISALNGILAAYLAGYGTLRFCLEFLRPDSAAFSFFGVTLSVAQGISLGCVIMAAVLRVRRAETSSG